MNLHYRTQGFVFKREDRSEADRVFSVYTRDFGRVEVVGKAIRKINSKLRSGMGIFSFSEIEFIQGRNKKTLTDAVSISKFNGLAVSPEKLLLSQRISEIIDNFVRGQEVDEKIFNALSDVCNKFNILKYPPLGLELVYCYFFWNFVSALGYEPQLFNCAHCHQKLNDHNLYFSYSDGGAICANCRLIKKESLKIHPDIVKVLRLILKKDWQILSKLTMEKNSWELLKNVTEFYYLYLKNNFQYE
ncbi:MAG: DNA repair protein RecO [Candidatus Staskawiczbacteria bacterium RIFCSPHIGHO2_12_FULL_38_11]|uniref:DNA repair protein RecO n=1 Tax=Candidatus Staskawiczbacteria bacterium RIFCSPHIGHO2_12_FULL_38_11 TaxID=1802209 RepID=A0A1G2I767_9BACT|nr:MAG: DNA repair protein RecO [Candidatus Staskawiczbacteria bacterium RIFCSPHIGHO2_12_FULL_38_11]